MLNRPLYFILIGKEIFCKYLQMRVSQRDMETPTTCFCFCKYKKQISRHHHLASYFVISPSHTDRKIVMFRTRKILIHCTGKLLSRPLR